MKDSIKDFFSKFDQFRRKLQIWSHLLKKSLMENFIFCAVSVAHIELQLWNIQNEKQRLKPSFLKIEANIVFPLGCIKTFN